MVGAWLGGVLFWAGSLRLVWAGVRVGDCRLSFGAGLMLTVLRCQRKLVLEGSVLRSSCRSSSLGLRLVLGWSVMLVQVFVAGCRYTGVGISCAICLQRHALAALLKTTV